MTMCFLSTRLCLILLLSLMGSIFVTVAAAQSGDADDAVASLLRSGDVHFQHDRFREALADFVKAGSLAPDRLAVQQRVALASLRAGNREAGLNAVAQMIRIRPSLQEDEEVASLRKALEALAPSSSAEQDRNARLRIVAARQILSGIERAASNSERDQRLEEAMEQLRPVLANPLLDQVEPWVLGASVAVIREQKDFARRAFEAIDRLRPGWEGDDDLVEVMAALSRLEANKNLADARDQWSAAAEVYRRALEGEVDAQWQLAEAYDANTFQRSEILFRVTGRPVNARPVLLQNGREALRWWTKAAEQGHHEAQKKLASVYGLGFTYQFEEKPFLASRHPIERGRGVWGPQTALGWYVRAAEKESPHLDFLRSAVALCVRHKDNLNLTTAEPLLRTALERFRQAAEERNAHYAVWLGIMYANGLGVAHNDQAAMRAFVQAVQGNERLGAFWLGKMMVEGRTDMGDDATAIKLFEAAANPRRAPAVWGQSDGAYMLGRIHYEGRGVPRSVQTAADWYWRAAQEGHRDAAFALGALYARHGAIRARDMGSTDRNEAIDWLRQAASAGHDEARRLLIQMGDRFQFADSRPRFD